MPWEFLLKPGRDKTTGDAVFVVARNKARGLLELVRARRIMRAGNEPRRDVPHEQVPADQIELLP